MTSVRCGSLESSFIILEPSDLDFLLHGDVELLLGILVCFHTCVFSARTWFSTLNFLLQIVLSFWKNTMK
jgi:hypothetical protein